MVRTLARRSAVGALAGLVAMAGMLAPAPARAQSGAPVPLGDSGTVIGWGTAASGSTPAAPVSAFTLPEGLRDTAFSKIVPSGNFSLALTAAGKVVVLGTTGNPIATIEEIPASVVSATVVDIATNGEWAGVVTSAGKVIVWGWEEDYAEPTDVPEGLTDVAKLAIGSDFHAAAVKTNGDVVMWGYLDEGGSEGVPGNLGAGVKALTAGAGHYYALKADGNVVAWGKNNWGQTALPENVTSGGDVVQIESGTNTGLALLDDGSLAYWGARTDPANEGDYLPIPESLEGKNVVKIAARENKLAALDDAGVLTVWAPDAGTAAELQAGVPAELEGADIAALGFGGKFIVALVTKVLEVKKASVAGTATVGQTLTGTPATFSGTPDATSSQWLADGVAIGATGTSLVLDSSHVGKRITFATTASKTGEEPFVSTSAQAGPVVAPQAQQPTPQPPAVGPVKSKPTFTANKVPTSKKKGKATVAVPAASGRAKATGKATITIKKGKTTKKIKVTLSGGKKLITLPKLKKGTWKVQVSYSGDKNYIAQTSKSYNLKIKK